MEIPLRPGALSAPPNPVLARITHAYPTLSRAERLVADFVLADPAGLARTPIGRITAGTGASAPTIMRFCRAAGFTGLTDLKLALVAVLGTDGGRAARTGAGDSACLPMTVPRPADMHVLDAAVEVVERVRQRTPAGCIEEAAALLADAPGVTCMASHDLPAAAAYARDALLARGKPALTPDAPGYGGAPAGPAPGEAVGLFFCRGLPTAALADAVTRYRRFGKGAVVIGDVAIAPFAQASVQIRTGAPAGQPARHGSTVLLPYLLITDLLVDALERRRGAAAGH